jgi:hypothetical protein
VDAKSNVRSVAERGVHRMTALQIASWVVRIAGAAVLVLGLVIWTGNGTGVRGLHMLLGITLVIALWLLALLAARAGVSIGLVVLAGLWGLITIGLGLTQERLLVGDQHWIVQVTHLVVGLGAIGIGEAIAARAGRRPAPA